MPHTILPLWRSDGSGKLGQLGEGIQVKALTASNDLP